MQFYHDISPKEMVEGKISFEGTTYQAATKLRKDDVRLIAKLAAEKNMLTSGEIWNHGKKTKYRVSPYLNSSFSPFSAGPTSYPYKPIINIYLT